MMSDSEQYGFRFPVSGSRFPEKQERTLTGNRKAETVIPSPQKEYEPS